MDKLLICTGYLNKDQILKAQASSSLFFAWDAEAVDALESLQCPYITLEDLRPHPHKKDINLKLLQSLKEYCNHVDSQLLKHFHFLKNYHFYPLTSQSTLLRKTFFQINQTLTKLTYLKKEYPHFNFSIIGASETTGFINYLAKKINFNISNSSLTHPPTFYFTNWNKNNGPLWKRLLKLLVKKNGPSSIISFFKLQFNISINKHKTALFLSNAYDMPEHAKDFHKNNYRLLHWNLTPLNLQAEKIKLPSILWPEIRINGVNFGEELQKASKKHLEENLPLFQELETKVLKILSLENIEISVSNYFSPEIDYINAIITNKKRKAFYLLHGGNLGVISPLPPIPLLFRPQNDYTIYCVYGEKISKHVLNYDQSIFTVPNIKLLRSKYFDKMEKN